MPDHLWSTDELRAFLTALHSGSIFDPGSGVDDHDRERFRRQALIRIVPAVERRLLADVGATVDPHGVAAVALEVAEDLSYGPRHTWLMVTEDPWGFMTDLVTHQIRRAYRAAVHARGDRKALKGIEDASSRSA